MSLIRRSLFLPRRVVTCLEGEAPAIDQGMTKNPFLDCNAVECGVGQKVLFVWRHARTQDHGVAAGEYLACLKSVCVHGGV